MSFRSPASTSKLSLYTDGMGGKGRVYEEQEGERWRREGYEWEGKKTKSQREKWVRKRQGEGVVMGARKDGTGEE